jgi:NADP-dependent 3-hydroxy acid dehydrogenase YdfG
MAAAILITGANRGLGFEFASQYSAEGWRVFAACRNPDAASKLRCLAQDTGGMLNVIAMDVTDAQSVRNAATQLKDVAIDVLIKRDCRRVGAEDRQCRLPILGPCVGRKYDGSSAGTRVL